MERLEPSSIVGMGINGTATVENTLAGPQNIKYRITIRPSNLTPRYKPMTRENRHPLLSVYSGEIKTDIHTKP